MTQEDTRRWTAVGLVTVLGAVLRLTDLGRLSFWIDEMITVCSADAIRDIGTFLKPACGNMHPPLYFLLVKWWSWGGHDEGWLRLLPAFFGVATVPVVYALGCYIAGRRVGMVACVLAACSPFLLLYDRELRMYSLLTLLSTASLLFFLRAVRQGRSIDWTVFTLLSILNVYVHYHAVLVLLGQGLLGLFWIRRLRNWRPAVWSLTLIVVAFAFWLPHLIYQLENPDLFNLNASDRFPIIDGFGLARFGYLLYAVALGQTLLPWRPAALVGVVAFGVLGAMGLWRARRQADLLAIVVATGAVPILTGFIVSQSMPRYYVFVAPIFFVIVAVGWLAIDQLWLRVALGGAAVLALGSGLTNYYRGRDFHVLASVDPWREVGTYLLKHARQGDCLLPIGSFSPVRYYTNGLAPFTTPVAQDVTSAASCLDADRARQLWIVAADAATVTQAANVVAALDARFVRVDERRFLHDPDYRVKARWFRKSFLEYRVSVYAYRGRPMASMEPMRKVK